jgi:hypothetical protein
MERSLRIPGIGIIGTAYTIQQRWLSPLLSQHEATLPFPLIITLAAEQEGVWLCPGVLSALRTGKLRLAGFLPQLTGAGLTPEELQELEHQELLDNISWLKDERTMSGRINIAEDEIGDEQLTQMQQIEPEFMKPIITGLQKRPERKAKAERAIQRILKERGEDQSHK